MWGDPRRARKERRGCTGSGVRRFLTYRRLATHRHVWIAGKSPPGFPTLEGRGVGVKRASRIRISTRPIFQNLGLIINRARPKINSLSLSVIYPGLPGPGPLTRARTRNRFRGSRKTLLRNERETTVESTTRSADHPIADVNNRTLRIKSIPTSLPPTVKNLPPSSLLPPPPSPFLLLRQEQTET